MVLWKTMFRAEGASAELASEREEHFFLAFLTLHF
jgi:hypothetical protein